jgi:hypothetical protein
MSDDADIIQSDTPDAVPPPHIGFVVSVEQLALLRDLLSAHPIAVVIDDCRNSALLDDQWKPWARRVRTQLKHVSGPIIVRAPSYSFPDPSNHPQIRDTIASQLQAVCDLAVMLAAQKIIIPIEAGIPALHLFSGLHTDYHRPSDTPDKLDLAGMSDIALWVEEAIVYLAMRDQPLRVTLSNAPVRATEAVAGARAASLGTIPEFNYAGEGVQISGVTPGGAAEAAGLQAGDILVQFNGTPITTLQEYSNFLREAAPGDEVQLQIRRAEELLNVEVILQAR